MRIVFILFTILLFSCGDNSSIKTLKNVDVDSLLTETQKNFEKAKQANKNSDSAITKKVDNTVKQIGDLENKVEELKQENHELKVKINDNSDDDNGSPYSGLPISPN